MNQYRRDQIVGTLFVAGVGIFLVYMFGSDIGHALRRFYEWLPGFSDLIPSSTGVAQAVWRVVGTLMAAAVLTAVYCSTGMAGRTNPSDGHGIAGIIIGFALLIFMTAFLYSEGYSFRLSLLVGAIVSVVLKLIFSYWRTRLQGGAQPRALQFIYHRREIRKE